MASMRWPRKAGNAAQTGLKDSRSGQENALYGGGKVPPPLAKIITLGVRDFAAERTFYLRLNWPQIFDSEDFAVFE